MKVFCETIFNEILPALRAIMANEMSKTHGLNQIEIAQKLGITQPAVSQYKAGLRGKNVKLLLSNPKFMRWIKKLTEEIIAGNIFHEYICEICKESIKDGIFLKKELQPSLCLIEMNRKGR